jgi:hypothetical protein
MVLHASRQPLFHVKRREIGGGIDHEKHGWPLDLALRARGRVTTELLRRQLRQNQSLGDEA